MGLGAETPNALPTELNGLHVRSVINSYLPSKAIYSPIRFVNHLCPMKMCCYVVVDGMGCLFIDKWSFN